MPQVIHRRARVDEQTGRLARSHGVEGRCRPSFMLLTKADSLFTKHSLSRGGANGEKLFLSSLVPLRALGGPPLLTAQAWRTAGYHYPDHQPYLGYF